LPLSTLRVVSRRLVRRHRDIAANLESAKLQS
jgi:hypothetical protein